MQFAQSFQINRNQMEYLRSQEKTQKTMGKKQAQSSRYMQSQRFIPPTHPAYVVTSNFEAEHITHLQEEFDKNYIAMGMQTGKKKLMKMPDMPNDRYFIVADDTLGPPLLEGQFLTLNSKVVHYPRANNAQKVISIFKDYIGLGHFETSQQYYQINDEQINQTNKQQIMLQKGQIMPSNNQIRQNTLTSYHQLANNSALIASAMHSQVTNNRSKIELREISTLRQQCKVTQGRLFIYENRKDNEQYKQMISQVKEAYGLNNTITYITRIDQYNNYLRLNRQHDNIILMSQYSFVNLAQYFQKYKAFAVFIDQKEKINFYLQKNVALFTSKREKILQFVAKFIENKKNNYISPEIVKENNKPQKISLASPSNQLRAQKSPTTLIEEAFKSPSISLFNVVQGDNPSQQKLKVGEKGSGMLLRANSPQNKQRIQLVRVTDLDKKQIQTLKQKAQPSMNLSPKISQLPPSNEHLQPKLNKQLPKQKLATYKEAPSQSQKIKIPIPQPKETDQLVGLDSNIEENYKDRSQVSQKSKIKRLKSNKTLKGKIEFNYPNETSIQELPLPLLIPSSPPPNQPAASKDNKKSNSLVKSHLRMGSDENHTRAHLKPKMMTHHRTRSDDKQIPPLKVCITSPKPTNSEKSESEQSECMQALETQGQNKIKIAQFKPLEIPKYNKSGIVVGRGKGDELKEKIASHQRRPSILKSKGQITLQKQKEKQKKEDQQLSITISKKPPTIQPTLNKSTDPLKPQQQQMKVKTHINPNRPKPNQQQKRYSFRKATFTQQQNHSTLLQVLQQEQEQMNFIRKNSHQNTHHAPNQLQPNLHTKQPSEQEQVFAVMKPKEKDMNKIHNSNKVKAAEEYYTASQKALMMLGSSSQPMKRVKPAAVPPIFQNNELLSNDQIDIPQISQIKHYQYPQRKYEQRPTFGSIQNKEKQYGLGQNMYNPSAKNQERQKDTNKGANFKNTRRLKHNYDEPKMVAEYKIDSSTPSQIQESKDQKETIPHFPPKARSFSQVPRLFNRSIVKPAIDDNLHMNPLSPRSNKSSIGRRPSTVGKIYSQLKCKPSKTNLKLNKKQPTQQPQQNSYFTSRQQSFNPQSSNAYPHGKNSPYISINSGPSLNYPQQTTYRPRLSQDPYTSRTPYQVLPKQNNQTFKNRGIQDLIDLSKYDRVIENGIVVYRSKYPIQTSYYSPSTITKTEYSPSYYQPFMEQSINTVNHLINVKPIIPMPIEIQQNPYLINPKPQQSNSNLKEKVKPKTYLRPTQKENSLKRSKSGIVNAPKAKQLKPKAKVQYKGNFIQQNVGIQCEADPLNSLVNINNQQLLQQISSKPSPQSPSNKSQLRKAIKSTINPIQDMLASKISNSPSISPQLILNMESPRHMADSNEQSHNDDEESIVINQNQVNQQLILYLLEKSQASHYFDQLNTLKTNKDSLITFKNQKQLSQQLLQTTHIYDIIYVVPFDPTKQVEEIIKSQPNCYIVSMGEGKTKIKGNKIVVSNLQHLKDVTQLLLKQSNNTKLKKPKGSRNCKCKKQYIASPKWQKACCHSHNTCCPVHHPHYCHG